MISPCEEVIDGLGFMGTITISEPVMSHQRPWYHHRVVALEPLHRKLIFTEGIIIYLRPTSLEPPPGRRA